MPNGVKCNAIALRDSPKCYHHHSHRRRLKRADVSATLSSQQGRLAALNQIIHAITTHRIDPQVARSMLYSIFVAGHLHPNDQ
jgi:hypothetical protein